MDSAGRPSTIRLKCHGRYEEARAAAVVTPGDLIMVNASKEVLRQATAGGFAEVYVATETTNALQGKGIDTDYQIGDLVSGVLCAKGDEMLMWLADGENVTPADFLTADGLGSLKKAALTEKQQIAKPMESLDLSGGGNTVRQRIKVRVL